LSRKLRLIVLGMMGRFPYGGQTWLYLNWLRGFKRLGHDVHYVEDDKVWPFDPTKNSRVQDCAYAVRHISRCMERIGLKDNWVFRFQGREGSIWGRSERELRELYRTCDAVLNIVGATDLKEGHWALLAPLRVYVETDPAVGQLRLVEGDERWRRMFDVHHKVATYGENYGAPDCGVPLDGITYVKTRQPIDVELWPEAFNPDARYFTTVGNYRQNGKDLRYKGQIYRWSKHHEWRKFIALPQRTQQPLQMASEVKNAVDRDQLLAHGWEVVPATPMSLDVFGDYPAYLRRSRAEFTVAKDLNVRLRTGWFSERDVCYLASGKPVIAQDTGFGAVLPTGEGLFPFTTMDDVVAAIEAINGDYERHCRAARSIAVDYFEAQKVAGRLLSDLGLA
jgi:hypothetical protein